MCLLAPNDNVRFFGIEFGFCGIMKLMKAKILRYNTIIRKEGIDFVAYVPTLGISDFGKTLDQAQINVKNAIECHIEGLAKTGFEIPNPDGTDYFIGQANVAAPKDFKFAY